MKLRKLLPACSALIVMGVSAAAAADENEFSANVALTTDYVFRGYSQTEGDPALQGGFDFSHTSGFYAGVWASNVESDPAAPVNYDGSSLEVDIYVGWSSDINGFSVDVGALRYEYPGTNTNANNTEEYHLGLGYDFGPVSASATANYSPDFFGADDAYYWDFGIEAPVVQNITLAAHYGITDYDDDTKGDDYEDWSIGASTELGGFGFDLTYTDTSGVAGGCTSNTCDGRAVFTVSKEF